MDKLIEKLGLYDIWTTIFPGGIFLILARTLYGFMSTLQDMIPSVDGVVAKLLLVCRVGIYVPDTLNELLVFFMLSYVAGSVLHELSSIFKHWVLYSAGRPTEFLLESDRGLFSDEEVKLLKDVYRKLMETPFNDSDKENLPFKSQRLFRAMNAELQSRRISGQYVKLNVIHNTCLTLSVALMLNLGVVLMFDLGFLISGRHDWIFPTISLVAALGISIVVLIKRSMKYHRYWVRNIVSAFFQIDKEESLKTQKHEDIE